MPRQTIIVMAVLLEACAHVAQTCHRIFEELRSESREAEIVDRPERISLHIAFDESDVIDLGSSGISPAIFQETFAAIEGKDRARGPDQPRKLKCRVPETASGIDDLVAGVHFK